VTHDTFAFEIIALSRISCASSSTIAFHPAAVSQGSRTGTNPASVALESSYGLDFRGEAAEHLGHGEQVELLIGSLETYDP